MRFRLCVLSILRLIRINVLGYLSRNTGSGQRCHCLLSKDDAEIKGHACVFLSCVSVDDVDDVHVSLTVSVEKVQLEKQEGRLRRARNQSHLISCLNLH